MYTVHGSTMNNIYIAKITQTMKTDLTQKYALTRLGGGRERCVDVYIGGVKKIQFSTSC